MTVHRMPGAAGPKAPRIDPEDLAVKAMGTGCLLAMAIMALSVAGMFFAGAVWMVRAAFGH